MTNRWLLRFPARPTAPVRLVCVPGAGCSAAMFRSWSAALPPDVEVCAVQPPGRGSRLREAPHVRMGPMADALAEAVAEESDRPVVLFGHSLGALVAFEVAERLSRSVATSPAALIVAAHKAPSLGSAGLPHHLLSDEELVRMLGELGGTPGEMLANAAVRRLTVPALRADFELDYTYEYRERPPLRIPISVFGGDADAIVSGDELAAWRRHTTGRFRLRIVAGGHFLHNDQGGADLFADLRDTLLGHAKRHQEEESPRVRG